MYRVGLYQHYDCPKENLQRLAESCSNREIELYTHFKGDKFEPQQVQRMDLVIVEGVGVEGFKQFPGKDVNNTFFLGKGGRSLFMLAYRHRIPVFTIAKLDYFPNAYKILLPTPKTIAVWMENSTDWSYMYMINGNFDFQNFHWNLSEFKNSHNVVDLRLQTTEGRIVPFGRRAEDSHQMQLLLC